MTDSKSKIQTVGKAPLGDAELHQWLKEYCEAHPHHDTLVLSRDQFIGVSRTALDAYLQGTYFLPKENGGNGVDTKNSKIESQIRRFREQVEGTVRHGWANSFVETRT